LRQKEERRKRESGDRREWDDTTRHEARAEAFAEVLTILRSI
jgi:hypothetical protein